MLSFFFFAFNAPDFTKPSSSNGVNLCEICFANLSYGVLVLSCLEITISHLDLFII